MGSGLSNCLDNSVAMTKRMLLINRLQRVKREYLLLALLAVCSFIYFSHTLALMRRSDPASYVYAGIRLAETGSPSYYHEYNILAGPYFTLHMMRMTRNGDHSRLYLNHSIGFPLLIAAAKMVIPWEEAIYYVVPFLGTLGLVAVCAIGASLFDRTVGVVAAVLWATSPVYLRASTDQLSDVPSLAFLLAGLAILLASLEGQSLRRGSLAGLLLGYGCFIRYPNVLALIAVGFYLLYGQGLRFWRNRTIRGFLLTFGLVSLGILLFNHYYYGGFFTTGYSPPHRYSQHPFLDLQYLFDESPVKESGYRAVWATLWGSLGYSLLLVPVALFAMPRRRALLLGGLAATFLVFYSLYHRGPTEAASRFLLPAIFPLTMVIAFGIVFLPRVLIRNRWLRWGVVIAGTLLLPFYFLPSTLQGLRERNEGNAALIQQVREFTAPTEENAVFLSERYNDWIIIYGGRAGLHFRMLGRAQYKIDSEEARRARFEEGLVRVLDILMENEIPVYYIHSPSKLFNPRKVLSQHYDLEIVRLANPEIHKVIRRGRSEE